MWKIKSCPRCTGDMFIEQAEFGWMEHCLQCGYQREIYLRNEKEEPVLERLSGEALIKV